MFEQFRSFADYIKDYELQRAEGVLLRHLSRVHKVLTQAVPDATKNDTVREMELYLSTMLRQVDSSLIENGSGCAIRITSRAPRNPKRVRPALKKRSGKSRTTRRRSPAAIRNRIFTFLRGVIIDEFEQALTSLSSAESPEGEPWTAERLRESVNAYYVEHERICLDANARNVRHTYVLPSEDKRHWRVQQVLVDPEEHNDWIAEFEIDLAQSRATGEPFIRLRRIGSIT
jgi:hypothetical protein